MRIMFITCALFLSAVFTSHAQDSVASKTKDQLVTKIGMSEQKAQQVQTVLANHRERVSSIIRDQSNPQANKGKTLKSAMDTCERQLKQLLTNDEYIRFSTFMQQRLVNQRGRQQQIKQELKGGLKQN